MNQNPNEYNPYGQPPSGPNYAPASGSGPNYPPTPNSGGMSGPNFDVYGNPIMPVTGPNANNPYSNSNPYAPPPPPIQNNPTQYGAAGYNDPTYTAPPPPPPMTSGADYSAYPPAYPQPMQPLTPMQPVYQQPPRQPKRGRTALISIIVLVVVLGAIIVGVVAHNNQVATQNANATATAQSNATAQVQAQATGTAQSIATATAVASTFPFFPNQVMNDPLASNNNAQAGWQVNSDCAFAGSSYQATDSQKNTYGACPALLSHYTDFTFQVDATLKQGDSNAGFGLYFRANDSQSQGYLFYIDQDGSYSLFVSTDGTGANSRDLKDGEATTSQFNAGLSVKNTLAVVAKGNQIFIYINQQLLANVQDSTYSGGQIGVVVTDGATKAVAVFNNAKVWTA